jgi:hypothetical protein
MREGFDLSTPIEHLCVPLTGQCFFVGCETLNKRLT